MSNKVSSYSSVDATIFEIATIVFSILINTGVWQGHPNVWCFNWIDHAFHNWFWVVFNTLFSVPVCCTLILCGAIVVIMLVIACIKFLIKALLKA